MRDCAVCGDRGCEFCPKVADPLAACRGILNGLVAGVILWAGIACLLFYGFRVAI